MLILGKLKALRKMSPRDSEPLIRCGQGIVKDVEPVFRISPVLNRRDNRRSVYLMKYRKVIRGRCHSECCLATAPFSSFGHETHFKSAVRRSGDSAEQVETPGAIIRILETADDGAGRARQLRQFGLTKARLCSPVVDFARDLELLSFSFKRSQTLRIALDVTGVEYRDRIGSLLLCHRQERVGLLPRQRREFAAFGLQHGSEGRRPGRSRPHAVWHRHGAQVALLRCPIPRDGNTILTNHAGGSKR